MKKDVITKTLVYVGLGYLAYKLFTDEKTKKSVEEVITKTREEIEKPPKQLKKAVKKAKKKVTRVKKKVEDTPKAQKVKAPKKNTKKSSITKPKGLEETYKKYQSLTNMTASELKNWSETDTSKKASLNRKPITRNIELLKKSINEWDETDIKEANKAISYLSRSKKIKRAKKEIADGYTKNEIAMKNWGYDVKK